MEGLKNMSEAFRRASLASSLKSNAKRRLSDVKEPPPKDAFNIVYILFLLLGILNMLPLAFFGTAYNYWMYKFRDVSSEEVDLNNKTTLQTYFAPGNMIAQSLPMVIGMTLSTAFSYKIKMDIRMISSLSVFSGVFIFFTFMIGVNTDTWQTGFFLITLLGLGAMSGGLTLLQISSVNLMTRFPPKYMHPFMTGQAIAGIFNGCLQIIALAVGTSVTTSAYIYFGTGTIVVLGTQILYIFSRFLSFFKYYEENSVAEERNSNFTMAEVVDILKDTWPCVIVFMIIMIHLTVTHPTVTSLVVSDNYGHGYVWNDTFFVPTITYLYNDVCALVGRVIASYVIITRSNRMWWVVGTTLRFVVLTPLIMLCNAHPRNHLPIWFPHDWEYILLSTLFSISNGLLFNVVFFSIPGIKNMDFGHKQNKNKHSHFTQVVRLDCRVFRIIGKSDYPYITVLLLAVGKEESAFTIISGCFGVIGGLVSPFSLLGVKLL